MFEEWRVLVLYFCMWIAVLVIAGGLAIHTIGPHNLGVVA